MRRRPETLLTDASDTATLKRSGLAFAVAPRPPQ